MRVKVHGAGEMVPAMEVFDAVSAGTAEMGHSASYYWRGKVAAAQFFTAVPFGMTTTETNAWLYNGDGQSLWDEVYAEHNLKPFPVGNTGTDGRLVQEGNQVAGRHAGAQAALARVGRRGDERHRRDHHDHARQRNLHLYADRGAGRGDWVGPYNDLAFGLHQVADYYYTSAWNEPSAVLEGTVNLDAWKRCRMISRRW